MLITVEFNVCVVISCTKMSGIYQVVYNDQKKNFILQDAITNKYYAIIDIVVNGEPKKIRKEITTEEGQKFEQLAKK